MLALVGVVGISAIILQFTGSNGIPPIPDWDPQSHPIYSQYKFKTGENVINIGTQPIFSPTGLFSEAMKRDAILEEEMESLGVELRFYPFLKGSDINRFIESNQLDGGFGGDMPVIIGAAELGTTAVSLVQMGFTSIVADDQLLVADMRGKSIGYPFGSDAHFALLNTLASEDIDQSDVNLVPLDVDQMPQALNDGLIDAFSAWEPFVSIAEKTVDGAVVIHGTMGSGYLYFSNSFFENHQEAVQHIIASAVRARRWIQSSADNMQAAARWSLEAAVNLSPVVAVLSAVEIQELARHDIFGLTGDPIIPDLDRPSTFRIREEFLFLQRLGLISPSSHWEDVRSRFDRDLMIGILTDAAIFRLDEFAYATDESRRP